MHGIGDAVDAVDGDDCVGGLGGDGRAGGAHRDPEVGHRERRSVVDAVADHDHGSQHWVGGDPADDLELVLGGLLGVDAVDAELATDPLGDRAAVARDHRDMPDPLGAKPVDDPVGVGAQLVGHHDHAGHAAIDRDHDVRLARARGWSRASPMRARHPGSRLCARTPGSRPRRGGRRRSPAIP